MKVFFARLLEPKTHPKNHEFGEEKKRREQDLYFLLNEKVYMLNAIKYNLK